MCVVVLGGRVLSTCGKGSQKSPGVAPVSDDEGTYLADAAIKRALVDVSGFPYEESLSAPLEEAVRQVDYALVQTMLRLAIASDAVAIDEVALRKQGQEVYHFQKLHISLGPDSLPFITALHESLQAWAEKASLYRVQEDRWAVVIDGLTTHEITLAREHDDPEAEAEPVLRPSWGLRPRAVGEKARLVIVMDDLGENMQAVRELLELPFPVTFAIWPHSSHAREAAELAHAAGKEILVHMPMEPLGYPEVRPGPGALMDADGEEAILEKLDQALGLVPYAVGLNNHMGSRFTRNRAALEPLLRILQERNMIALDSLTHPGSVFYREARSLGLPALRRDIFLDDDPNGEAIWGELRKAENVALVTGRAIAIGHPRPETLKALREWAEERNSEIVIVCLRDLLEQADAPDSLP